MPNNDGTGPNGQGSLTGRGMGNCEVIQKVEELEEIIENTNSKVESKPINQNIGRGQGLGKGRRGGRCCAR